MGVPYDRCDRGLGGDHGPFVASSVLSLSIGGGEYVGDGEYAPTRASRLVQQYAGVMQRGS